MPFFFFLSFFVFEIGSHCVALAGLRIHFVDQAGLKVKDLPVSASQLLGLKACTTMPGAHFHFEVLEYKLGTKLNGSIVINVGKRIKYISSQTSLQVIRFR